MGKLKYYFTILLTYAQIAAIGVGLLIFIYAPVALPFIAERANLDLVEGAQLRGRILGAVIFAIGAVTWLPLNKIRRKAREASKFDEYGRLKGMNDYYNKMSVKEQKEFDKERIRRLEAVLPATLVKQMTKKGSTNPDNDMNALIGLEDVKFKMREMAARMEFETKNRRKRADTAMHMVFFGPPGTGKTTVARIMTGYLHKYGYIKQNRLIETAGSFFVDDKAVDKAEALIQQAYGGVLFIDEAYAMMNSGFGAEAVAAIIKQMEDARGKFILILAGYTEEMKGLLQSNTGFLSRIKDYFYFSNYSIQDLVGIFVTMANQEGYQVSQDAANRLGQIMEEAVNDKNFGNARTCRNILDKSIDRHSLNEHDGLSEGTFMLGANDIVYEPDIMYFGAETPMQQSWEYDEPVN